MCCKSDRDRATCVEFLGCTNSLRGLRATVEIALDQQQLKSVSLWSFYSNRLSWGESGCSQIAGLLG